MNRRWFIGLCGLGALLAPLRRLFGKSPEPEWHRMGFRYDPRKGGVKYYLDGEELPGPVFPSGEAITFEAVVRTKRPGLPADWFRS